MIQSEFRLLTKQELTGVYREHMKKDFPPNELKALAWILRLTKAGAYEPYGLFRDGELISYAFYWRVEGETYVMLDYFAVVAKYRNQGVGSRLLKEMLERFCTERGLGVFGEVEAPISGDCEVDDLRRRRLGFYDRAGFRRMGFRTRVFDVTYDIIDYGPPVTDEELIEVNRKIYHSIVPKKMYEKKVFIPEVV